jgi:hypothetical protein
VLSGVLNALKANLSGAGQIERLAGLGLVRKLVSSTWGIETGLKGQGRAKWFR